MGAAVDHVHHRHRQRACVLATEPAVEGDVRVGCGSSSGRERAAEDRVRSETPLVRRPVDLDEHVVERSLLGRVEARRVRRRAHRSRSRLPRGRPCRGTRAGRRRGARPPRAHRWTRRTARPLDRGRRTRSEISTSTVGFPRESRIWRPWTRAILVVIRSPPLRARSSDPERRDRASASPRRGLRRARPHAPPVA